MAERTEFQEKWAEFHQATARLLVARDAYLSAEKECNSAREAFSYVLGQCAFGIMNAASIVENGDEMVVPHV